MSDIKRENETEILKVIGRNPYTFTQILTTLKKAQGGWSERTLTRRLNSMIKEKLIFKEIEYVEGKKDRMLYTATHEAIIKKLILPECMAYAGSNLFYWILTYKTKIDQGEDRGGNRIGEDGKEIKGYGKIELGDMVYYIEPMFEHFVEDKYPRYEITAKQVLDVMMSIEDYKKYVLKDF